MKVAIDVKRAVPLVNTIPMLGLNIDSVEAVIVDPDPEKSSITTNNTFFKDKFFLF